MDTLSAIKKLLQGEVKSDKKALDFYSHDTSLFEITPQAIIFPKNSSDIKKLVKYVSQNKESQPNLSITARSGGTDMTGGAINDSLIMDFTKHLHKHGEIDPQGTWVEPGLYYRKFEKVAHSKGYYLPSYPASKNICALGGMVANNSGGEKSLSHGKTIDYVDQLKVVLSDGEEYLFGPLDKGELEKKLAQKDFEGEIYRRIYNLIEENYQQIKDAKPHVSKNSTGYNLWDVWDKKTFNLAKLFVGSQGTLGVITDIKLRLIKAQDFSGLLIIYLDDTKVLPQLIKDVLQSKPESFEAFDEHTLALAIRFIPQFIKILGLSGTIRMGVQFTPDLINFASKGLPKYVLLVEYAGASQQQVTDKISHLHQILENYQVQIKEAKTRQQAENYWVVRRESFNLLRKNVKNKHTAPFIDDFIVPPDHLVEFFPQLIKILEDHQLNYTVAGHMGDGNFHIIPLMDLSIKSEREKIPVVAEKVNRLVIKFKGSISAEHNEGLIRGPFIKLMYGAKMYQIFQQTKKIFDPQNIFNPHKKTDATMEYSMEHIREHF